MQGAWGIPPLGPGPGRAGSHLTQGACEGVLSTYLLQVDICSGGGANMSAQRKTKKTAYACRRRGHADDTGRGGAVTGWGAGTNRQTR